MKTLRQPASPILRVRPATRVRLAMSVRPATRVRRAVSVRPAWVILLVLIACLTLPSSAAAQTAETALDLLHAGSRQALGLGGDPFLSPLDDECGWWSTVTAPPKGSVALRMQDYSPLPSASGGESGALYARRGALDFSIRQRFGSRTLILKTSVNSPASEVAFGKEEGRLSLSSGGSAGRGWIRLTDPLPGSTLQVEAPLWSDTVQGAPSRMAVGYRWDLKSCLRIQGTYAQGEFPLGGMGYLLEEPIPFGLNLAVESYDYDLRLMPSQALRIEASAGIAHIAERQDKLPGTEGYEFMPQGRTEDWQFSVFLRMFDRHQLLVRQTRFRMDTDARFYLAGMQFARLSYLRADLESWLLAWDGRLTASTRILGDVEFVHLQGKTYGYVESWPFTDGIIDLLGMQQNVRARGQAHWTRAHLGMAHEAKVGMWECGVNFYDVDPELQMLTWQPVVLGMGWRDVHEYELLGARARLLAVSLGCTIPAFGWELSAGLQQFVLAKSEGDLVDHTEAGGSGSTGGGAPSERPSRGGTFFHLGLSYSF